MIYFLDTALWEHSRSRIEKYLRSVCILRMRPVGRSVLLLKSFDKESLDLFDFTISHFLHVCSDAYFRLG